MEIRGHRSNAVRTYTSDKIRRQASAAIQGAIKLGDEIMECDANGHIVKRKGDQSDTDDFEPESKKLRTPKTPSVTKM